MPVILFFALILLTVLADQISKYFVYQALYPDGSFQVIENLFSLIYVENRGIAFGMFQGQQWLFVIVTMFLIVLLLYLYFKKKVSGRLFTASVIFIIGGGVGNMIDRIFRGFVIDFLSISFFPPVCNLADYFITIGAFLLILSIVFMPPEKKVSEEKTDGE